MKEIWDYILLQGIEKYCGFIWTDLYDLTQEQINWLEEQTDLNDIAFEYHLSSFSGLYNAKIKM